MGTCQILFILWKQILSFMEIKFKIKLRVNSRPKTEARRAHQAVRQVLIRLDQKWNDILII